MARESSTAEVSSSAFEKELPRMFAQALGDWRRQFGGRRALSRNWPHICTPQRTGFFGYASSSAILPAR
jgi:hypothetical protein